MNLHIALEAILLEPVFAPMFRDGPLGEYGAGEFARVLSQELEASS